MAIIEENFAPSPESDSAQRVGQIETYRDSFLESEEKAGLWQDAVAAWFKGFLQTNPNARDFQLTQALIGGTPDKNQPVDTEKEEIYSAALDMVKKVRAA